MYRYVHHQIVSASKEEVWRFFATPANLPKLTPKNMKMQLLDDPPETMYPGMVVRLKVAPLLGISLPFTSVITTVKDQEYFIDEMREGPFAEWHHEHRFEEVPEGTLIYDLVHYRLPLGPLGKLFQPFLVKKQIVDLFAFRKEEVRQRLETEAGHD